MYESDRKVRLVVAWGIWRHNQTLAGDEELLQAVMALAVVLDGHVVRMIFVEDVAGGPGSLQTLYKTDDICQDI